jgi:hypothetical protein
MVHRFLHIGKPALVEARLFQLAKGLPRELSQFHTASAYLLRERCRRQVYRDARIRASPAERTDVLLGGNIDVQHLRLPDGANSQSYRRVPAGLDQMLNEFNPPR